MLELKERKEGWKRGTEGKGIQTWGLHECFSIFIDLFRKNDNCQFCNIESSYPDIMNVFPFI